MWHICVLSFVSMCYRSKVDQHMIHPYVHQVTNVNKTSEQLRLVQCFARKQSVTL